MMNPSQRTLVFGDLHQAPNLSQLEDLIAKVLPDQTVFLGDYFDQWDDHFDHAYLMAKWLRSSLQKPKRIHLWGNHDLPYGFPGLVHCPGHTEEKQRAIRAALNEDDWAKLSLWYYDGGWLFTHAGLSAHHLPDQKKSFDLPWFERETHSAWRSLKARAPHWVWARGGARGASECVVPGGIVWCDFEREFEPIQNLNQMFGHTPNVDGFRTKLISNSQNWCIDVSSRTGVTKAALISGIKVQEINF